MSHFFAFGSLLKAAKNPLNRLSRSGRAGKQLPRARFAPRLEILEDRSLPSTFTVVNLHDSGAGSLRQAVLDANAHVGPDTIAFADELHGTIRLTSGELLISDSVTINGPGEDRLSVSGNDSSRIFDMTSGQNVTIRGLTITDGYALDQGGGILNQGSNLTLSRDDLTHNVVFEGATTGGRGGALRSLGGNLTITDCQITDNQALGAAVASAFGDGFGGGLYILAGSATITGSTISGNLARGGDNSSDGFAGGGGILTDVPTSITACTISDNLAQAGDNTPDNGAVGGGLYIAGAFTTITTITGSTFSGNQAVGGNGGTGSFVAVGQGGAINTFGTVSISVSTFDHNLARGGSGGNSGLSNAGPFVDYAFGGAISNTSGNINVTGSSFSHNEAVGGNNSTCTDPTDIIGVGGAEGGAFYNEVGAAATLVGSTFDHNQAIGGDGNTGTGAVVLVGQGLGGAIVSGYGGNLFGPNTLTVTNCTVTQNEAEGGDNNSGTASVSGLVGTGAGAGIANYAGGTASVSGSELDHNQARGGDHNTAHGAGAVFASFGAGAGIFNYLGNFNSSAYGLFTTSVVSVTNSTLDHNQAEGDSRGNGVGGGIANLLYVFTTVAGSTISQNAADGDDGGAGLGGGAYNDATSSLALTHSSVRHNNANGSPGIGGGIYTRGTFSFDPFTVIDDNHASTSGDNFGP